MRGLITVGAALVGALLGIALGPSSARTEGAWRRRAQPFRGRHPRVIRSSVCRRHSSEGTWSRAGSPCFDHAEDPLTLSDGASPERVIVGSRSLLHVRLPLALGSAARLGLAAARARPERRRRRRGGGRRGARAGWRKPPRPLRSAICASACASGCSATTATPSRSARARPCTCPRAARPRTPRAEGAVRVTPQLSCSAGGSRASCGRRGRRRDAELGEPLDARLWRRRGRAPLGRAATGRPGGVRRDDAPGGSLSLTAREVEVERTTSAELLIGAQLRPLTGLVVGAAAGPGIGDAIGTPSFRADGHGGVGSPARPPAGTAADAEANADPVDGRHRRRAGRVPGARSGPASADARRRNGLSRSRTRTRTASPIRTTCCPGLPRAQRGGRRPVATRLPGASARRAVSRPRAARRGDEDERDRPCDAALRGERVEDEANHDGHRARRPLALAAAPRSAAAQCSAAGPLQDLIDGLSFRWDISTDEVINDGTNDAFDTGMMLRVDGSISPSLDLRAMEIDGRQLAHGPALFDGRARGHPEDLRCRPTRAGRASWRSSTTPPP